MDVFRFADELGPAKVIHVYEPSVGLKGVLVVDNVARGPSIGGLRIGLEVCTEECFRLARTMTLKNSAADLPHGGGKSVIYGDPRMPKEKKEQMIRAFASSLREIQEYIFGPDMGTDEECMAWVKDEIGRAVGLPCEFGGIPLDELGATAWGSAMPLMSRSSTAISSWMGRGSSSRASAPWANTLHGSLPRRARYSWVPQIPGVRSTTPGGWTSTP